MHPKSPINYLAGYPEAMVRQVMLLIEEDRFAENLLQRYPLAHEVRTDKALYDYVLALKQEFLRNAGQLSRVAFDSRMSVVQNALGTHTRVSRVQGSRLTVRREIRVAAVFKLAPPEFLRMIVVHELAHIKERSHDKAFYQLCLHMEPDYHRLEFDLRSYLTHLELTSICLWASGVEVISLLT